VQTLIGTGSVALVRGLASLGFPNAEETGCFVFRPLLTSRKEYCSASLRTLLDPTEEIYVCSEETIFSPG
jgi:hypothetical protein